MVLVSGIAVVDMIGSGLERLARPGQLVFCSVRPSIGGHACNVSADLVGLGLPPGRLRTVFPAGRDVFGAYLARELRNRGIRATPVPARRAATSLDLILVARGEDRRYHADPGASAEMTAAPVLELVERYRPGVFYAGGVGLLGRFDTDLPKVLRRARRLGALTFVDVVSPYGKSWDGLRPALPWMDVFHCNADEARAFVGEPDPVRAALRIQRLGARNVLVTRGGEGWVAAVPGAVLQGPAYAVRVVDPTGAGDAFSAGVLLRLERRLGRRGGAAEEPDPDAWKDILIYASACGAVCATGVGTTTAVEAGRVEALLRRQGSRAARAVRIETRPAG